nr:MAG TPA: hypothetical protein [Caudoviricetes sp.]
MIRVMSAALSVGAVRAAFYFVFCRRRQIVSYKVSLYKWEKTVIFSQLRGQVGKKSRFFPVELFGISEQLVTLLFRGKVCIYLTKKVKHKYINREKSKVGDMLI